MKTLAFLRARSSAPAAAGSPDTARRGLALGLSALPLLPLLSLQACKPRVHFNGIDLTGASYARDFDLMGSDGQRKTIASFKGKVVMVFFGFTQCPDVCPTALARAAAVQQMLGAQAADFQVLFVTIDPERDTPELLGAYTAAFGTGVLGLAGDLTQTAATAKEFKVFYQKVPTGSSYTMDHSTLSYLFDRDGQIRVAIKHEAPAAEVAADAKALLEA